MIYYVPCSNPCTSTKYLRYVWIWSSPLFPVYQKINCSYFPRVQGGHLAQRFRKQAVWGLLWRYVKYISHNVKHGSRGSEKNLTAIFILFFCMWHKAVRYMMLTFRTRGTFDYKSLKITDIKPTPVRNTWIPTSITLTRLRSLRVWPCISSFIWRLGIKFSEVRHSV